ncbi:Retrovirus-related Pol polyprotein from transposon.6 [Sesamum angolense]|uniref:Retrovirus-related Pol polyprotein from transposon.6 n=1 Tax=Sesamum angolense TaxID=2727404 RepID=A0AAE1W2M2_9LAMI|nr:Retrovirus-related Pol polyprotein from transposon.6 [Sesamum angolense]
MMEVHPLSKESNWSSNPDDQKGVVLAHVQLAEELLSIQVLHVNVSGLHVLREGHNMEVDVDEMLVKSRQIEQHLVVPFETFDTLRKYHIKLNPAKCAFGVQSGKFVRYMITEKGIKINPENVQAIQEMKPPTNLIKVQRLVGRIAAFSRFISRSAERSGISPVYQIDTKRALYLYLAVSQQAISSVLIKDNEGYQKPSYYVSKVLHGAEQQRTSIKAQSLIEFVNEATLVEKDGGNWLLHANGSSTLVDWRKPLLHYFIERILLDDEMETARLKNRAARGR